MSSRTAETVRLRTLEPVRPITQAPHPTSPREGAGRGEGAHFRRRVERFLGRLEQALELYDRADQSSELRQQIAALQAEITALRKIVSEADIQRKLQNAVARAGRNSKRASNSQLARRRGPHSCVVAPGFLKFCAILFLKILICARVVHRPPLLEEPEMAVRTETSPPGGSAPEFASRVAPRRCGATVLTHAVTTAGDGPTSRRTNFAISREGSRPLGAAASPRLSRSGLFSNRGCGNFPACKALKTHEMRKFSPSSLRAKREMDYSHADKLGSAESYLVAASFAASAKIILVAKH